MPRLLSGSTLRRGGSGEFIDLAGAQPQLPPTETTATGFTIVTDSLLRTSYRSSLGFIEFRTATMYSSLPEGTIRILATGSTFLSLSTTTGNLVVQGGIGVGGNMHIEEDIVVNGLTIGRGYEGKNNIVITGTAEPQETTLNDGQESIAIGYSALEGISSSYKNIAIGRFALHSGTNISNSIAIGDSALKTIGYLYAIPVANISNITNSLPAVVTANSHGLSSGTYVIIKDVLGMSEINDLDFWVKPLDENTLELYENNILSSEANSTGWSAYISGGVVERVLLKNNNIAIGVDAGKQLIDGEKNFFIGDGVGKNLTTGSNNFFVGHDIGENITYGNNNIAIGGDNLVDGLNDQVNIGSVFYYNGNGELQLNADTETGLGTVASIFPSGQVGSTSTFTGGLVVIGGLVVTENSILNKDVRILSNTTSTSIGSGALVVAGGVGINGSLNVGENLTVAGSGNVTLSPQGATVYIQPELGGTVLIEPSIVPGSMDNVDIGIGTPRFGRFLELTATIRVNVISTENAVSSASGALVVAGGAGISKDLYVGGRIFGPAGADFGSNLFISTTTTASYYIGLTQYIGTYSTFSSSDTFIFEGASNTLQVPRLELLSTLSSTVTNLEQSLVVNGGGYIAKGIYSPFSGIAEENNLVYTPRISISTSTPLNPRVGDFWIDPTYGVELQYIQDGANRLWIQFAGL